MAYSERVFLPAAGRDWLLPLYDPLTRLLGANAAREALVAQAELEPLHRVLDVGCGTGTMAVAIRTQHPTVKVNALDPDAKALARARRKAARAGVAVEFDQGFSDRLPYPDAVFDRVFSSMMFHHLESGEKKKTLSEVRRVLKPGGRLHMLDFAAPGAHAGLLSRVLHAHARLRENQEGQTLRMMTDAGLTDPRKIAERRLRLWTIAYYQAARPI